MAAIVLSLMVLTVPVLLAGAWAIWRRKRAGRQVALMLALAAIVAINVAIWTMPDESGKSLVSATPDR